MRLSGARAHIQSPLTDRIVIVDAGHPRAKVLARTNAVDSFRDEPCPGHGSEIRLVWRQRRIIDDVERASARALELRTNLFQDSRDCSGEKDLISAPFALAPVVMSKSTVIAFNLPHDAPPVRLRGPSYLWKLSPIRKALGSRATHVRSGSL